jgi:Ca-activated chloride channel family protein
MFRPLVRGCALVAIPSLFLAQDPVIRVNVNLVHVIASVRNQSGELVGALTQSDFEIFDNGVRQDIAVFAKQSDQPLSVALLIDTSGSTSKDLKFETASATRFLHVLLTEGRPDDSVALYSFNYDITELQPFTHNHRALETSLNSLLKHLKGEAGTSLYDAIYYAARALENREGRKVIVVITDGGETTSSRDLKQALEAVQLADAVIYPLVVIPVTNDAGRNIGGEHALAILAERTGGRTFLPAGSAELDRAFSDLLNELRTQYVLGFYPHGVPLTKERFHSLQVRVKSPELRVSARNGYYGEAEGDSAPASPRLPEAPGKKQNHEE